MLSVTIKMHTKWKLQGDRSVLYPIIQKRLKDELESLIKNQVTSWVFMTTPVGVNVKKFDGKKISYSGIEFSGSPEEVFWGGYIEPFLEHISFNAIDEAVEKCKTQKAELKPVLNDIQELLKLGFNNVFAHMADVDRRLRGKGYPERVSLKSVDSYVKRMEAFVARRIESELTLWKSRPWVAWIERFYENNKGLVWVIGAIISVLSVVAAF